jgi:hypothetical protein
MALAGRMGWSIWGTLLKLHRTPTSGAVAQLGERLVRNEEATGSIPVSSTKPKSTSCSYCFAVISFSAARNDCAEPGAATWPPRTVCNVAFGP